MAGNIRVASRVCQLEAHDLDQELDRLLNGLIDGLELSRFSDECKLLVKIYLNYNVNKKFSTVGMNTYNMSICDARSLLGDRLVGQSEPRKLKLVTLLALNLVLPYTLTRLNESSSTHTLVTSLNYPWLKLENIRSCLQALKVINFLVFLVEGKYLNIQNRLLGLVPCVDDRHYGYNLAVNQVQMQIIHRATILKSTAEFLTFILPYLNGTWLKNKTMKLKSVLWQEVPKNPASLSEKFSQKTYRQCSVCSKQPFNPYTIGCRHVSCYYCIKTEYLSDPSEGFRCKDCDYVTKDESEVVPIKLF